MCCCSFPVGGGGWSGQTGLGVKPGEGAGGRKGRGGNKVGGGQVEGGDGLIWVEAR